MPSLEQLLSAKPEDLESLTDEDIRKFAEPYRNMTIPHLVNPEGKKFGGTGHITKGTKEARRDKLGTLAKKEQVLDKIAGLDGFDFMKDLMKGK
jgi:hypothetical protein